MSTSFFGRQNTIDAILAELNLSTPLIQVVGPPGVGKSTVLRQIVYKDHTPWLVDLTDCLVLDDVLLEMARVFDIALNVDAADPMVLLAQQIEHVLETLSSSVLLLDNAEQLSDILGPTLNAWSTLCSIVVATRSKISTVPCTIAIEPWPPVSHERMREHPGMALFLATATRQGRVFKDAYQLNIIASIVDHLQGLPLMIELVAARISLLTPKQLLERLQEDGLAQGNIQQRLHHTISWSWSLLDDASQYVLAQCALYRTPFSQESLEALLQDQAYDVTQAYQSLLNHCLIRQNGTSDDLLLCVREFASEHIQISHEQRFIKHIVQQAKVLLDHTQLEPWHGFISAYVDQLPNVKHAYHLACKHLSANTEQVGQEVHQHRHVLWLRMLLWTLSVRTNNVVLYRALFEDADALGVDEHDKAREGILEALAQANAISIIGSTTDAIPRFEVLYQRCVELKDDALMTWTYAALMNISSHGANVFNEDRYEHAIQFATSTGNTILQARLLRGYANAQLVKGELDQAIETCAAALALSKQGGDPGHLARTSLQLGSMYIKAAKPDLALEHTVKSISLFRDQHHIIGESFARSMLIWASIDARSYAQARYWLDDTLDFARKHGLLWQLGVAYFLDGQLKLVETQYTEAAVCLTRAAQYFDDSQRSMRAATVVFLALANAFLEDLDAFDTLHDRAFADFDEIRSPYGRVNLMCLHVLWHLQHQRLRDANQQLELARTHAQGQDVLIVFTQLYEAFLHVMRWERSKVEQRPKHKQALLNALAPLFGEARFIERDIGLRIGFALLKHRLPDTLNVHLDIELSDPDLRALLFDPHARLFRPPHNIQWVELDKKRLLFHLLTVLVEHRINAGAVPLAQETIKSLLWPNEVIDPHAADNRLYVALTSLRQLGHLSDVIVHLDGGYMIHEDVPVRLMS